MTEDDSIEHLLPDYVNGLLSEEEARRVEAAAGADADVAAQIAFYRRVKAAEKTDAQDGPPDALGWARLSRAIDEEARAAAPSPSRAVISPLWRYAAAVLAVVALGQFVMLAAPGGPGPEEARYVTASDPQALDGYILKVAFAADARQADITALLQSVDGEIAGGPSALGLFLVSFEDEESETAALEAFENNPELVESAVRE